jgi:hypothetical protein
MYLSQFRTRIRSPATHIYARKWVFWPPKHCCPSQAQWKKTFCLTLNVMILQKVRNECIRFGGHVDIEVSYKILQLELLTPKHQAYDREISISIDPILQPYILIKIQIYIFGRWRNVSITSCEIFMHCTKISKLLWIFEVILKKIHINYTIYLETSIFSTHV